MLLSFYWRIVLEFENSIFGLNKSIMTFYRICFIVFIISGILFPLLPFMNQGNSKTGYWEIVGMSYMFSYIILLLSLSTLFIYKLFKVYKYYQSIDQNDHEIIQMITKLTVLNFQALVFSLITGSLLGIGKPTITMEFILQTSQQIDVFTNFLVIILAFNCYDSYYFKLCRWSHNCCQKSIVVFCLRDIDKNTSNEMGTITADNDGQRDDENNNTDTARI